MVDYMTRDSIAVIQVNNPPVNALSVAVRKGIADKLESASHDARVKAVVITGKTTFISGADITEFKTGAYFDWPILNDLCNMLESCPKPVVAAIHGYALGGGHEVAISCHYRVAHAKAKFGFPEVDLGILPAASGTQRFPRLAGLKAALDLIPTGRRIGAQEAAKLGIVDKVTTGDVVEEAIQFAKSVADQPLEGRRTSKMTVRDAENASQLREAAVKLAAAKKRGMIAPIHCINAVMASVGNSFERGMEIEMQESAILFSSGQTKALRYAFFAERAATKWEVPGGYNYKNTKGRPISKAAVVGAGTMGTGIAMAILNAGIPVTLIEQNQEFLNKGMELLRSLYAGSVKLGRLTEDQAKAILSTVTPQVGYKGLNDIDAVIEAVYENMELKKSVFAELDKACPPKTFLWTNTSHLNIDEIASATQRPDKVMGTHFFAPAYYMRIVENIWGKKTSPETIASAQDFGAKIGKVSVLVGNCYGFVANRTAAPYGIESEFLVEEGCLPQDVDLVAENFGFPIGRLKVQDLSGLDIKHRAQHDLAKKAGVELSSKTRFFLGKRFSGLSEYLCEQGHFGRKTGRGWYNYGKPHGKIPLADAYTRDMIMNYCKERGIQRRRITYKEIEERLILPVINEGFKVLEEGIVTKPEIIDITLLIGYGWPRHTGGPMFYANSIGLDKVYQLLCHYAEQDPYSPHWVPSNLLKKLAANKTPMKDWANVAAQSTSKL